MGTFRWPVTISLMGHALALAAVIALDRGPSEPPPKPVEIALVAPPESLDALTLEADATPAVQPQAASVVQPVDATAPPPPEAQPPVVPDVARAAEPDVAKEPPPDVAEVKPVEQIAEVKPDEPKPVEEVAEVVEVDPDEPKPVAPETVKAEDLPRPKPPRPAPPRPPVAQRPVPQPVADAPPAPPAPPAQTALVAPPAPRPALPAGPSNSYLAALRAQLERHKNYPELARRRQIEGTTMVRFTIDRRGAVVTQQIVRSSGYSILDQEVSALVMRASPLPPLPADVEGDRLEIVVPINFSLR